MRKILLGALALSVMVSLGAEATVVRGSVPNRGAKLYTFTPDFTGTVLLNLIFDNVNTDLDIRLAVRDENNELIPLAFSESELKQFETMQIGVLGGVQYTIVVISSHGPSPFRLNFDGTFTTTSTGAAGVSTAMPRLREVEPDAAALRLIEATRKHLEQFKKQ